MICRKIVPHRTTQISEIQNYITSKNYRKQVSMTKQKKSKRTRQRERQRRRPMRRQRNGKAKPKAKANAKAKEKDKIKRKSKAEATAAAPRSTKQRTSEESAIFQKLQFPESGLGTRHCRNFTQAS